MKKKWIKDLVENEVIHTPEKWMAEKVVGVLRDMGQYWEASYWEVFKEQTCYYPFDDVYDSVNHDESQSYNIYSFHDLLDFQESEDKLQELEKFMGETIARLEKLLPTRPSLDYDEVNRLRDEHAEMKEMLARIISLVNDIDSTLFHHNHSVNGWHLNGDSEPMMNFVSDFDMGAISEAEKLIKEATEL